VISVDGLGKCFGSRWVFRGLGFEISKGHRLVVTGHNGCGKSTLLKILSGLLSPTEGLVRYANEDYRSFLGYAALDMAMYSHLSASEHLELASRLRGCDCRSSELLLRVGLAHAKDLPASQLSTGMRARLKLALAIQADPVVLLLDEPGASLDDRGRELVGKICDEQAERGCLVIATNDARERRLATHELELGQ
jgi:ABC-type multidrug transport system ATPase subunit